MKRLTVTLNEDIAAWAHAYAARHNTTLPRMLVDLLQKRRRQAHGYDEAISRFLRKKPVRLGRSRAGYPSRDALHDRTPDHRRAAAADKK